MKSSDSPDGKQVELPKQLVELFSSEGVADAFMLRSLWRALDGQRWTGSAKQSKMVLRNSVFEATELAQLAERYNGHVDSVLRHRPASKDSGRARARLLGGVNAVFPNEIAQRFPNRLDPSATPDKDGGYQDVHGRVECDAVLRTHHLGLLGALGGIYGQRERESLQTAGVVGSDGAIYLSANQMCFLVTGARKPGKTGTDWARKLASELNGADFSAVNADKRGYQNDDDDSWEGKKKARNYDIRANPLQGAITRRVRLEGGGSEYAALDDPRPTSRDGRTFRFELPEWYRQQLEGDRRDLVFVDMKLYRRLKGELERRVLIWLLAQVQTVVENGRRGKKANIVSFFNGEDMARQLGYRSARRFSEIADAIHAALLQLSRLCERFEWVYQPVAHGRSMWRFAVRLKASTDTRIERSILREGAPISRLTKRWIQSKRGRLTLDAQMQSAGRAGLSTVMLV